MGGPTKGAEMSHVQARRRGAVVALVALLLSGAAAGAARAEVTPSPWPVPSTLSRLLDAPDTASRVAPSGEQPATPQAQAAPVEVSDGLTVPDPALRAAIAAALGLDEGADPTPAELAGLTSLYARSAGIVDLTGLEHATNLTALDLYGNAIVDVAPLAGLTALSALDLGANSIADVAPLAALTALTVLYLDSNALSDVSPLDGLDSLGTLYLSRNVIADVAPLAELTSLGFLYLDHNRIADVAPLAALVDLLGLGLAGQAATAPSVQVAEDATAVVAPNIVRGPEGEAIAATSAPEYVYDAASDTVTWPVVPNQAEVTYAFDQPVTVGSVSEPFSGLVRVPLLWQVFADVPPGAAFYDDIAWMYESGITRGSAQPDGSVLFEPAAAVRREAMAAFLYRFAGEPAFEPPANSPFVDVPPGAAFYKEITWLAAQGITNGTDLGGGRLEFRPAQPVSREAMAAFLFRFEGRPAFTAPSESPFVDVATDHAFYLEIAWLAANGISTGTPVGDNEVEFRPDEPVSREATAAFLHRTSELA